jgi:4-hydroxymandelate oxidase
VDLLRRLEAEARERLAEPIFDYFAGGAGDERTLDENPAAWQDLWLVPRQARGIAQADPSVQLLGARWRAPVALAPAAAQRLLHPDGEPGAAAAAAAAGLPYCLSTRATADLAEVAQAAPDGERWFQLYVAPDRERVARMLRRLAGHGYTHVVLTVDLPVAGRRERERRHGELPLPEGVVITSHLGPEADAASVGAKPHVGGWAALTWQDVEWVADESGLPVLAKGILCAADAELAIRHGAAGLVVSNHGARQLDGTIPTAVALPDVVDGAAGRVPVLVDGGIRSGADVVRALALGADAVLIGRPFLWGLACGGADGVTQVLDALVDDVARSLALVGAPSPRHVEAGHVKARR